MQRYRGLEEVKYYYGEQQFFGDLLSYLGGLSMLLKFGNEDSCSKFLLDNKVWCSWFSSLDPWNGQSLLFERLAWIRIIGVPMHLADNDVLNNIAEHFGKIVHGSNLEAEDGNLSVSWIGLLVGEGERIRDFITLKWSNKMFRVWIEEEFSAWVPEFVGLVSGPSVDLDSLFSNEEGENNLNDVSGDGGVPDKGSPSGVRLETENLDCEAEKSPTVIAADVNESSNEIHNHYVGQSVNVGCAQTCSGAQGERGFNVSPNRDILFFSSQDNGARPKKRSFRHKPRKPKSALHGVLSPNSEERPRKRNRDQVNSVLTLT
ncbi:hypothetical protein HanRHA438_Chr05g0219251 [Helianthus annuus]|uniref:DUF4283 domain-containing protein n=1 Tax=Helianthus annuus TaxID=4232 RepID=A0A9K3IYS5_HELAN|nr:hypothetical protein HanXRQr2_Chr05g0209741 [Helianthus annuus]KAJ0569893.1 hypothetical protein HanHA300_Chr05g0171801 [Helianthus annuus]KAJ0584223.1 hypothetical protein HanHA89_Chr05g0186061 [Helianthus annuus]KAJ0749892.1 hypothetical protein HanLR1_Chr05g0175461 [Helianthus annuus]KAJ0918553.1 hypothetical protein HanRHA438_Chr05g0219251 [Helianthus annuus]